ncbi:HAD family hydrolase [Actinosynnema sp. NPDC059797]
MTDGKEFSDTSEGLRRLLEDKNVLLLDFDGPICSVFSGVPAPRIAGQLREVLASCGHIRLPPEVENSADPFSVLRHAVTLGRHEGDIVEETLRACEVKSVASAEPTPGAEILIESWRSQRQHVAVVTNNSEHAVSVFLKRTGLYGLVAIFGRTGSDPEKLKPSPYLISKAIGSVGCGPESALMVGDSVTDVQAAQEAGVACVGFANKPSKVTALASADLVITRMSLLTEAL